MRYGTRLSVVTVAIAAGATVALLLFGGRSSDATIYAPEPSIPPDCYVADEPTDAGPAAPSDLTAEWSPYFIGGILVDAFDVLTWTDNADDETCFVIEMKPAGGSYEVVAVLGANANSHHFMSGPGTRTYRVYGANADGRSAYSNEDAVNAVDDSPTPTPSPTPLGQTPTPTVVSIPSPTPSLSPSTVTPTPTPSTVTPTPTPAALPKTGGLPD